jgi:hypothetical protein
MHWLLHGLRGSLDDPEMLQDIGNASNVDLDRRFVQNPLSA